MPNKTTTKKTAPAAPLKKPASKKIATPKAPKASAFTQDAIALRAYFIAEKRQRLGLPGDTHSDWVEAERQLATENGTKPKGKKTDAV